MCLGVVCSFLGPTTHCSLKTVDIPVPHLGTKCFLYTLTKESLTTVSWVQKPAFSCHFQCLRCFTLSICDKLLYGVFSLSLFVSQGTRHLMVSARWSPDGSRTLCGPWVCVCVSATLGCVFGVQQIDLSECGFVSTSVHQSTNSMPSRPTVAKL